MARAQYTLELEAAQDDLLLLGQRVETAIGDSVEALQNRDFKLAEKVVEADDEIDRLQIVLEERCIDIIAMQAPMASDLRRLVTIIHVGTELERIADYAEGIAKIVILMGNEPPLKRLIDIPRMAQIGMDMLRRSLQSLVALDAKAAGNVAKDDDMVDALYQQILRELLGYMIEDPSTIQRATYLLWVAHDLERIGDRATNIAERAIYLATGSLPHFD